MIFPNLNLRQAMISNQILSVDQILFQEIAMTMYKIHNGSFPRCINEFFIETPHPMSTRSNRSLNLENPRIQLTKQSLNYKGNLVWSPKLCEIHPKHTTLSIIFYRIIQTKTQRIYSC